MEDQKTQKLLMSTQEVCDLTGGILRREEKTTPKDHFIGKVAINQKNRAFFSDGALGRARNFAEIIARMSKEIEISEEQEVQAKEEQNEEEIEI